MQSKMISSINYTQTPHESHEIHDSSPYAILFIFMSCTIGGKLQIVLVFDIANVRTRFRITLQAYVNRFFFASYCSANNERMAYPIHRRFDCSGTLFWSNIRCCSNTTKVRQSLHFSFTWKEDSQ